MLRDVSIDVPTAEIVTLIGPNGHGKTTLLRAISGLVRVTGGEIRLEGQRISGRKAHQIVEKGVVQIPQGDILFTDMSVQDNLMMGAYPKAAYVNAPRSASDGLLLAPSARGTPRADRKHPVGR